MTGMRWLAFWRLRHAEKTGEGQQVDMALLDTGCKRTANLGANYLVSGNARAGRATRTRTSCPTRCFEVAATHWTAPKTT
jgi:crotonobetainyl-CoA:carnitine CoA-transferase CaiB-like acyl-CoA transferase